MTDEKLIELVRKSNISCQNPKGRFGEDECNKCASCKVIEELIRRDKINKKNP